MYKYRVFSIVYKLFSIRYLILKHLQNSHVLTLPISKQTKHTYTENTPLQVILSQSTLTARDMNLQELTISRSSNEDQYRELL